MNIAKCAICKYTFNLDSLATKTGWFNCPICGQPRFYALEVNPDHLTTNPLNRGLDPQTKTTLFD
jgi:DNA-directed RNA polymerase subunit RPC12/RpoP